MSGLSSLTGVKCEHRVATTEHYDSVRKVMVPICICHECGGHWLSLGPAAPDTEAVRVERRAAELAARRLWDSDETEHEKLGLWAFAFGRYPRSEKSVAGYLAAFIAITLIATHDERSE